MTVAAAMAVAYALPVALFRHSGAYSATGRYVMLAIAVTMAAFATIGIWHCTLWRGHTLADPVLFSDDSSYWDWAVKYSGNGGVEELHRTAFPGLPLLSALLLKLLGKSVVAHCHELHIYAYGHIVFCTCRTQHAARQG